METIKPGMFFIAADGDGIGKLVGRAVIANDVDELHKVSNRIDAAQDFILHWCENVDGIKVSGGGDEFTAAIPQKALAKLESLRKSVEKSFGYTVSIGVGRSLSEAGTSLLVAKLRGKDRIVYFNKKIKEDIKKAKRRVREGRASQEEYKLSEAYLEKSENMLCDLHKNETKALVTNAKEGKIVPKRDDSNRVSAGKTKPTRSHEEMLKLPHWEHDHLGNKHRAMAAKLDPHNNLPGKGNAEASARHAKAASMHHAYEAHLKDPNDRTNHMFVSDEKHAEHQKESGEKAKKLHEDLSSIEVGSKMTKSEEGFHEHPEADDEDNRTDDCAYCQDLDAEENADGTAGMHDCPACADYDAKNGTIGGVEGCQACADYDAKNGATPIDDDDDDDHDGCPECARYDAEQQGTPAEQPGTPAEEGASHPDNCPECQELEAGAAIEDQPDQTGQEDPNLQGHETAEQVLNMLDQEPGSAPTPAQEAKQIDNTELPQGDAMKENASVPENFGPAQKADVSDSEQDAAAQGQDEPDMAGVLQSGLDDHANEQKKQQVIDMVSQTLAGFKANKAALEATKDQNQALYNSCIQMLKSMIALCDLLGLKPKAAPEQAAQPAQEATQESAPPQGAAPTEGPADPKAPGQA